MEILDTILRPPHLPLPMAAVPDSAGTAQTAGDGGTVVQLPPAPPSDLTPTTSNANANPRGAKDSGAKDTVSANIARRTASRDARKRKLLLEARKSRVAWILNEDQPGSGSGKIPEASGNLLGELRACQSDILPCAPEVAAALLSSTCAWHPSKGGGSSQNGEVRRILEERGLSWEAVSKQPSTQREREDGGEDDAASCAANNAQNAGLDLPQIPSPEQYDSFLQTLCEPSAADVVMSTQKFCKTIREAANVMVASMAEGAGEDAKASGNSGAAGGGSSVGGEKEADVAAAGSESSRQNEVRAHGASLAKAVKGFVNSTVRQLEEHDSFRGYLHTESGGEDGTGSATAGGGKPVIDGATKEQLQASVERFVFGKCRGDIDRVLSLGDKRPQGESNAATDALQEKMRSLQFVTPAHLEIECLKSSHAKDVDLSYTINQLQSLETQSSPRQMLRSILLAHRGVTASLKTACESDHPPGADDVLPTLILATLRAHPAHLSTILGVIEHFAPLALLRGEVGYAYTNLCGAVQFIKELDVEGHLAEVALGVTGEGAVLSIGPEEFRAGLEECRRKMKEAEEEKLAHRGDEDAEAPAAVEPTNDECWEETPLEVSITARQVREARSQGETVDFDWAIKRQNEAMWQQGRVGDMFEPLETATASADAERERPRHIPPEDPPLPSQFSRSYSFLTTSPSNIGVRDLPRLLEEYKMLVHATERLLNERTMWRENERKRQLKLERDHLERDFAEAVGPEAMEFANGH